MNIKSLINTILLILLIVAVAILFILHFGNRNAYVYVDTQKLVQGYAAMQDARKEFEVKSSAWKANLDTLRREAEAKIQEYEKNGSKLSAKEKALMEELIESRQQQYMNYQQIVSEKIQQEDQQLSTKVLSKVNDYIRRYGEKNGYTIIMAATQYGNIVYAKDRVDITEEVLKGLNEEYSK